MIGLPPADALGVLALVPARDEADRVGATVRALGERAGVDEIVVIDDGSRDATADEAARAGARVLRTPAPLGKGTALEGALSRLPGAEVYLLVDGDVGGTAGGGAPLLDEVLEGRADLAVGVFPAPPTGGFGLVRRAAGAMIRRISGFEARAPLSGQRAITRECLEACRPLAPGFGLEVGLTADAVRMGYRVAEIEVPMEHRFTRRDPGGFAHRARQGLDALRAFLPRVLSLR